MKAISYGNSYEIFDDSLKTYEKLPPQNYIVRFAKEKGFFLEKYPDMEIKESKIYGIHTEKVKKVLKTFTSFERNLGVILSGDKGIGKSLFAKLVCIESIGKGYPVIVVDRYIPGIDSYLNSIEQEVVVLFDEFDKTFCNNDNNGTSPQTLMLSLFDGISVGKKLFLITCNEIRKLNDYLINRPGRFHYHFRFDYPSYEEIQEYLQDKLDEKYYGEIEGVVAFSRKVNLNYDCLRAIAYEISNGQTFKEAIKDLNIVNIEAVRYETVLHFEGGATLSARGVYIDFFSQEKAGAYLYDNLGNSHCRVAFDVKNCIFDGRLMTNVVKAEDLNIEFGCYDDSNSETTEKFKQLKPSYLTVTRETNTNIHYAV